MSKNNQRTSKAAMLVLILGLVTVGSIFIFSFYIIPRLTENRSISTIDQAKTLSDDYLLQYYPTLQVVEIMEFSNQFYIRVVENSTQIGALELLIDRATGRLYFEPGPNMMWNTKYGHMGRVNSATANMTITPSEASLKAQIWLDKNFPESIVEEPQVNYGYYTFDFMQGGTIRGMLSVNGDNGDVWYHSWHGQFISEKEYS